MPKKILRDVISSTRQRSKIERPNLFEKRQVDNSAMPKKTRRKSFNHNVKAKEFNSLSSARFAIWGIAICALVFFLFVLLSFFSATVIKIVPVQKNVTVSGPFRAVKAAGDDVLSYNIVIQEHSTSTEVPATGEKKVHRKASGKIVIYNKYSSKPEELIKRTRFETEEGYEYRIDKPVIVPGTTVEDGNIVPGSIEVTVYADIPGDEYNIGLTEFTIPGLKGGPRFSKFYAESKTPMTGGFSGIVKIASTEDIKKAKIELENSLKETLLAQARAEVPDYFVLYDDAVFFSFGDPDVADTENSKKDIITVTASGVLHGVLFKDSELSKSIAENTIDSYTGDNISIDDLDKLEFTVVDRKSFDPATDTEINFTLFGSSEVVWDIDGIALARDLAGKDKTSFLDVRSNYPGIERFEAIVRPFWKKTFPKDPSDISIKIMPVESE